MNIRRALCFDDVMMVPRYSTVATRSSVHTSTQICGVGLRIPIIAANMSSICETEMGIAMADLGGMGIIHRMCSVHDQATMVYNVATKEMGNRDERTVGFSIGVGDDWNLRMDACRDYADLACLDIAHAHHFRVIELLKDYFQVYRGFPLIIGQIATASAVRDLLRYVPEQYHKTVAFKTSIGGGSLCTTRIKTGFGVPTLQAVMDIEQSDLNVAIIADGGIKSSGDIVKSLAAGADAVMLGGLLAGTDETPGGVIKGRDEILYKVYRGSASFSDKSIRGEETRNIEGEETLVPYRGPVKKVVNSLMDGIRSGFSYAGAETIRDLQRDAEFVEITTHGFKESLPHGK